MEKSVFNPEIGHFDIQERILASIKNDHLPHAFLFFGNEGTGKEAFAIELAKLLNCEKGPYFICRKCPPCLKISHLQHPDIKFVFPTPSQAKNKPDEIGEMLRKKAQNPYRRMEYPGKNIFISIDTIRDLKNEAKFKLYEGKKKAFIISEADQMRPEASNSLLKILEEPPQNLMLILITSRIHRILPTIRSRCQLIHFPPLEGDLILKIIRKYTPDPPDNLARIIRLALENIKLAFDFIDDDVLEKREQAIEFLRKIVLIENSHELLTNIESFTAKRDRRNMKLLLFFMLTWFRDIVHLKNENDGSDHLINYDLEKNLAGFAKGYPGADYSQIITRVQNAVQELEDPRNLNPALIFINLSIILNRLIKQK